MFYVLQNESTAARRRVPILLTDAATGTTAQSGVALTNIYSYVNSNGGAFSGGAGTVANSGFGQYYYEFDPGEIGTLGLAGIHITAAGCRDYDAIAQIAAFDLYSPSAGGGISAYDVWYFDASTFSNLTEAGGLLNAAYLSASSADNNANIANTQTIDIAAQVWGEDIGTGLLSPFAAGTAGTILYTLGQGGTALTAGDVWSYATRTITGGIADTVTDVTNGVIVTTNNDKTGYALSSTQTFDLTGNLSGSVGSVTADVNVSTASMTGIAGTVWDYASRTITGGIADTVQLVATPVEISYPSMAGLANTIWSRDISGYTSPSAGFDLTQAASGGAGLTAGDVWSYTLSNAQTAEDTLVSIPTDISNVYSDTQNIYVDTQQILSDISGLPGQTTNDVWNYTLGNAVSADTNLVNAASGAGISAHDVWDFVITGFGQTGSAALYTTQTNFTTGNIETYVQNQTPQDVWTYSGIEGRTITGGLADTVTTLTNRSGFAITGGTITTVSDKTGYSLSASQTFDLTGNVTGNLSGSVGSVTSAVDVSTSSMSGIANTVWSTDISGYASPSAGFDLSNVAGGGITAGDVWTYATREITGGIADTVTTVSGNVLGSVNSVVTDVTISTGTQASIANSVWSADVSGYTSPSAGFDLSNASSGAGLTAGDVWTYATREITGGIADTVTTLTNRSGFAITGGTVDTVTNGVTVSTNNDKTGYSLSGSQSFNLTGNITGNLSGSVGSVSGNVGGSVNSVLSDVPVNEALISADVWGYVSRTLTSGAGISAGDVWSYATRTVTGGVIDNAAVSSIGLTALAGIAETVWRYQIVGASPLFNAGQAGYELENVGPNVWGNEMSGYTIPTNFAGYKLNLAASGATSNDPANVWSYASRTLTSGGSGISAFDVWNFVLSDSNTAEVDLVQAAAGSGLTAGDVWSAASRTITGGIADTVTTLTDRAGFAITGGTVDNVTNGVTVSTNNDKTGYALSSTQTFDLTGNITGNLSGSVGSVTSGVTVTTNNDKTGYALSGAGVSAVQSGLSTLTQAQVGTEVDASLVDVGLTTTVTGRIDDTVSSRLASASYVAPPTEAAIAGTVWSYTPRTLTSGAGATAGDVWTYPTRSLTSGAGITVNAATNIINGPYLVKSNVDGQDGTLDVIRGMVQDIQLTVTDAFQNPFDLTSLGMAVNFYDQAGSLVTSYGTTNLYAAGGLIQFTLDQVVTANEGRYNLILSAAGSGNTIKFGPLQTLVRPF